MQIFSVTAGKIKMPIDNENENDESRPATPRDEDCCHNACDPCIFDVHEKLLTEYKKRKKQNIKINKIRNALCPSLYKRFVISELKETAENYILISVDHENEEGAADVYLEPGQYVMLHAWGLTRPFTPIIWSGKSITFLAKLYPNGKFTTMLRHAEIGAEINIRGPYGDFSYKRNSFQYVVMFSMGSGIAAHYPIARRITDDELEETRVHLVGTFQKLSQIPLKRELQNLSDYWNFQCTLYISQPSAEVNSFHGINMKMNRLNEESCMSILRNTLVESTLVLICGSEKFIQSIKSWVVSIGYTNIQIF